MLLSKENIRKFYIGSILLLLIGLMFSRAIISISHIVLGAVWFLDGEYKSKFKRLFNNKAALIFLSIYGFFLVGMLWTENTNVGLRALQLKLTIFVLPFILASMKPMKKKELKFIMLAFSIIVIAKSFHYVFVFVMNEFVDSIRKLSTEISHIRFSLMIDLAIFSIIYLIRKKFFVSSKQKFLCFIAILWLSAVHIVVLSFTGIVIYLILIFVLSFVYFLKIKRRKLKYLLLAVFIIIPIFVTTYLLFQYKNFYDFKDPKFKNLPKYTLNNNKYIHDSTNVYVENGYKMGYYSCPQELKKEWNKRAQIKYDSLDKNGYPIKYTLIRYLTSLGLPKDSLGVSKLTKQDINNIEKSIANYRYENKLSISNRVYKIFWQFHIYKNTNNPNNQSLTQRIEFWKTATIIIKENFLIGVGTGDLKDAFKNQYEQNNTKLDQKNRHKTHNQYLTFWVLFGVFIGSWCIFALIYPFFKNKKFKEFLPSVFFIIVMFSMLNEDTLNTSVGITFFGFFYSLLILQGFNFKDE